MVRKTKDRGVKSVEKDTHEAVGLILYQLVVETVEKRVILHGSVGRSVGVTNVELPIIFVRTVPS